MTTASRIPARRRPGRRSPAVRVAGAVGAALALAGLAGCAPVTDVRGNWHLVAGSDAAGDLGVGDALVTMIVTGGSFSGRGPCNDYSGTWDEDQGPGMLAAMTATTLGCPDDGDLESRYFQDLGRVSAMRVEDGHLVATGPDDVRLEYAERSRG